jgi:hypothetical protein
VVDIIDSHDVFKNQWKKRKAFYKKENYKIIYTTSKTYTNDISKWTTVFEQSSTCVKKREKSKINNSLINKKNTSRNSDLSITNDSEDEIEEEETETIDVKNKNDLLCGKCLISFKKN